MNDDEKARYTVLALCKPHLCKCGRELTLLCEPVLVPEGGKVLEVEWACVHCDLLYHIAIAPGAHD